jgi:hypothetical protein
MLSRILLPALLAVTAAPIAAPAPTVTARDHNALVTAHLTRRQPHRPAAPGQLPAGFRRLRPHVHPRTHRRWRSLRARRLPHAGRTRHRHRPRCGHRVPPAGRRGRGLGQRLRHGALELGGLPRRTAEPQRTQPRTLRHRRLAEGQGRTPRDRPARLTTDN